MTTIYGVLEKHGFVRSRTEEYDTPKHVKNLYSNNDHCASIEVIEKQRRWFPDVPTRLMCNIPMCGDFDVNPTKKDIPEAMDKILSTFDPRVYAGEIGKRSNINSGIRDDPEITGKVPVGNDVPGKYDITKHPAYHPHE